MTISNVELLQTAERLKLKLDAVISSTQLADMKIKKSMNLIINLDAVGGRGSHWVALVIDGGLAFYFDSFGAEPDRYVQQFCRKNKLHLAMNTYTIQNMESTQCGLFCLALLKYIQTEKVMTHVRPEFDARHYRLYELSNDFVNMFEPDTGLNNHILYKYLGIVGRRD